MGKFQLATFDYQVPHWISHLSIINPRVTQYEPLSTTSISLKHLKHIKSPWYCWLLLHCLSIQIPFYTLYPIISPPSENTNTEAATLLRCSTSHRAALRGSWACGCMEGGDFQWRNMGEIWENQGEYRRAMGKYKRNMGKIGKVLH